jgi:hypothetical protein
VVVLNPAGRRAVTVALAAPATTISAAGGELRASLTTGASCPWAIDGLPTWISLSGLPYGTGPATLALTLAPNPDVPRAAALAIGGQAVTINQAGVATISGVLTLNGKPLAGATDPHGGALASHHKRRRHHVFPQPVSTGPYTVTPTSPDTASSPPPQRSRPSPPPRPPTSPPGPGPASLP